MGEWSAREEVARLFDGLMGRGAYYAHERQFWHALWRVPPIDAVEEHGIEARHYGPVRAFAYRHEPLLSLFNVVLGADLPGAISRPGAVGPSHWRCRAVARRRGRCGGRSRRLAAAPSISPRSQ